MISSFKSIAKAFQASQLSMLSSRSISLQDQKMKQPLSEVDPDIFSYIEGEKIRQKDGINLIASENYVAHSVLEALGSVFVNKYSEGYVGARFYGGNQFVDKSEGLCQKRALEAFDLNPKEWSVNVQPLSGSPANFHVYTALLKPGDRIMNLDLPHGGHISHGFQTETRKVSAPAIYFETLPYRLNLKTGYIDYGKMEELAKIYRPKMIVAGASAYPRLIDYKRMYKLCKSINALLLTDMAHIAGLVAAKQIPSPFPFSDIVTTTTHKTLRGPRGAMIFHRNVFELKNEQGKIIKIKDIKHKIDNAVFPGCQGGPHEHTISALAVTLGLAKTPEFAEYQKQILLNCKAMAKELMNRKYDLVSGGTDNHLVLISLKNKGIDGARLETLLELANIYVNKNTIPGDKSAVVPSGLRLGTAAMTTRGLLEADFVKVIEFLDRGLLITKDIKKKTNKLGDFKKYLKENKDNITELNDLKAEVQEFISKFDIPN